MLSCVNVKSMSVLLLSCEWNRLQDGWVETWESGPVGPNDAFSPPTWILPHVCASCSGHGAVPCCLSHSYYLQPKTSSLAQWKSSLSEEKAVFFLHAPSLLPSRVCLFRPCLGCGHNELGWLPWLQYGSGMIFVYGSASCSTWKDVVCVLMTVGYVVILMILTSTLTSLNLNVLLYELLFNFRGSQYGLNKEVITTIFDCWKLLSLSISSFPGKRKKAWCSVWRWWKSQAPGGPVYTWESLPCLSLNTTKTLSQFQISWECGEEGCPVLPAKLHYIDRK